MARKRNQNLMSQITELVSLGYTDADIAKQVGYRTNLVQHYRHKILGLAPNWVRRDYDSNADKIKGYMIRNIKYSAKRRGIPFDLTYADLDLPELCPLLNIPLTYLDFAPNANFNSDNRATVDRFNNELGYIKGNVWVISRLANNMKNSASLTQLEFFSNQILLHIENHRALGGITVPIGLDP